MDQHCVLTLLWFVNLVWFVIGALMVTLSHHLQLILAGRFAGHGWWLAFGGLVATWIWPVLWWLGPVKAPRTVIRVEAAGLTLAELELLNLLNPKVFGVSFSRGAFKLMLYPRVAFQFDEVEALAKTDYRFARALQLTAELKRLGTSQAGLDLRVLIKRCDQLGVDWNGVLDSKGEFVLKTGLVGQNYLTAKDLVRVSEGKLRPSWLSYSIKAQ